MEYPKVPLGISAAALIIKENKILLGRRGTEPNKGKWDIISGFVDPGECLEDALKREIEEEIGCKLVKCEYLFSSVEIYDERQIITIVFTAEIEGEPQPSKEMNEFKWILKKTPLPDSFNIPEIASCRYFTLSKPSLT